MSTETPESAIVHACPPSGYGLMPCCQRPPLEVPSERITDDPARVTCAGIPAETPETAKVPAELIDILGERIHDGWHEGCEETGCNGATRAQAEEVAHEHLAAVLPAMERQVRATVIADLRRYAEWFNPERRPEGESVIWEAFQVAARIAETGQP